MLFVAQSVAHVPHLPVTHSPTLSSQVISAICCHQSKLLRYAKYRNGNTLTLIYTLIFSKNVLRTD